MKGLFIGLIYGAQGIFNLIVKVPFLYGVTDCVLDFPTCGFFFLMNIIILAIILRGMFVLHGSTRNERETFLETPLICRGVLRQVLKYESWE